MATADDYAQWIVKNSDKRGTPEFETVAAAYKEAKGQNSPVVQAGKDLNSIPRQLGLTARYGLEGLANTAQIVTEPIRYATDRLTGNVGKTKPLGALATDAADWMGLPKPQGAMERVIGDASRLVAGSGGTSLAGKFAQSAGGPVASKVGEFFASAPVSQAGAAGGAGLAGGSSREAGGNDLQQGVSSFVGGVAGGLGVNAAGSLANAGSNFVKSRLLSPKQIDIEIGSVLNKVGVDYSGVPERIRQSLREDLKSSLVNGDNLDPAALARLVDFRRNGLTPTRGSLTLDPNQVTKEMNLAKLAANTNNGDLSGLPLMQNQNNAKLIQNLDDAGAATGNIGNAGSAITSRILGTQAGLRGAEQSAWDAAKGSAGYKQPISAGVLSDVNKALGDEGLMPFMNPTISKYIEAFQTGQPFTPQDYRNLQSMLSREISKGGNEGAAARTAANVLLKADLRPAGFGQPGLVTQQTASAMRGADNAANDAISLVNQARKATKTAYGFEESSPLVKAALSDGLSSDPLRIVNRFVINGTPDDAKMVVDQLAPQQVEMVKNAILAHLKDKALNNVSENAVGKFSQSAFNKALKDFGDKLPMFFSGEEIGQLQSMGRAASYMQFQPVGSAVNNSNSAAMLLGKGMDVLEKLPFVGPMTIPAINSARVAVGTRAANNLRGGLLSAQESLPWYRAGLAPAVAVGGLLAAPQ